MKKNLLYLSLLFVFCIATIQAQVSSYSFSQTGSSYGSANTGSIIGLPLQDDDVNIIGLPFTFTFNGSPYSNLEVCSNGYISFNTLSGFEYTAISDINTQEVISPFAQDLFMGVLINADITTGSNTLTNCSSVTGYSVGDVLEDYNFDFSGTNPTITAISGNNIVVNVTPTNTQLSYSVLNRHGYIKQNTSGTSPNRIFELEYRNFSRFAVVDEMINFKIRLYETTNMIEFLYGPMSVGNDVIPSEVGLKGSSNSDFKSREVNFPTTWNASLPSTTITDFCDFDPSLFPASGLSYKWLPLTCITPTLSVAQSNTVLCSGNVATLTASGASTYTWVNGPTTSQFTIMPVTSTSYTLLGENSSCTRSLVVTQSVIPGPTLSISSTKTVSCAGQLFTLTATGANSYTWANGVTSSQLVVGPQATASYSVIGSSGTCTNSAFYTQQVIDCTGLKNLSANSFEISVYPNPFTNMLTIQSATANNVTIQLIDALGKVVYTANSIGEDLISIDTAPLTKGFYFLKISNGSEIVTKKVLKN